MTVGRLRNCIDMASAGEDAASRIMVFRPTLTEFRDFSGYITHMEEKGAHKYGIAKVSCAPACSRGRCGTVHLHSRAGRAAEGMARSGQI